jgi:hypothetical protein
LAELTRIVRGGWLSGPALALAAVGVAHADSDGHFCTSIGYVAYELREELAPESRQVLKIVHVGGDSGIADSVTVPLDDFQVHAMKCGPQSVVLFGLNFKYTVALAPRGGSMPLSVQRVPAGQAPRELAQRTLGGVRQSMTISVPSERRDRRYQLQLTYRERRQVTPGRGGLIFHETVGAVIELDANGDVLREKLIHRGTQTETVD